MTVISRKKKEVQTGTASFELKEWSMEYADDFAYHANNMNIASNLRDSFPHPYTREDAGEFISSCIEAGEDRQLCRAIVVESEAVGSIGIFLKDDVARKSAEIGYWLSEDYWNLGIMGEAVKQMCSEAFERYGLVRIYAEPFAFNVPSQKVLRRAGFQLEGTLRKSVCKYGQMHDSCMYALIKEQK